jgi:membrane protein implicated in regulation of membrane protease activity
MTPHHWLLAAIVFMAIEILPPATHFSFLCLALGALAGAIASAFTPIVWVPWVAFVIVSIALLPVLIPLAKFLFAREEPHT